MCMERFCIIHLLICGSRVLCKIITQASTHKYTKLKINQYKESIKCLIHLCNFVKMDFYFFAILVLLSGACVCEGKLQVLLEGV